MAVTLSQASFLGLLLETLVFGIFLLVFCVSMYFEWEIRTHPKTFGKKITLGFLVFLFCLITTHWLLNVWGCYDIYVNVPPGALAEYALLNMSEVKSMIRMTVYEMQVWMGDVILIFRLYYVCGRRIVNIIFPCITCVAAIVCSSNFLHALYVLDLTAPQSIENIRIWCTATLSLTFVENCYCAGMITAYIWRSQRDMRSMSTVDLNPVLRIFVESAGMWIVFMFVNLVAYVSKSNIFYLFLYLANPILGISFSLMTVRLNLLKQPRTQPSGSLSTSATVSSHITFPKHEGPYPTITPFPYLSDVTRSGGSSFSEKKSGSPPGYDANNMV